MSDGDPRNRPLSEDELAAQAEGADLRSRHGWVVWQIGRTPGKAWRVRGGVLDPLTQVDKRDLEDPRNRTDGEGRR